MTGTVTGRTLVVLAVLSVLLLPTGAVAQDARRVARIGLLTSMLPSDPLVEAFRQGLRELGYIDGKNVVIEYRSVATELVQLKVDVIVAGSQAAVLAKQATTTIPIVMPIITDPVRLGLVASLASPGGNATGFATQNDELPGKWLALLKEALPRVSRVAVLFHPSYDGGVQSKASEAAARSLDLQMQRIDVEGPDDFAVAFERVQKTRSEALVVSSSPLFYGQRTRLVDFAAKHRLPTIYHQSEFVIESGGLMSYGPDFRDLMRRSATYVDKILKGARPGDLPVQQPTRFELVINRKTAHQLGLTLPERLFLRADRVVD